MLYTDFIANVFADRKHIACLAIVFSNKLISIEITPTMHFINLFQYHTYVRIILYVWYILHCIFCFFCFPLFIAFRIVINIFAFYTCRVPFLEWNKILCKDFSSRCSNIQSKYQSPDNWQKSQFKRKTEWNSKTQRFT